MAIPFYNQADQDIYASGDKFIPQEQYRLNYTPSTALASTVGNTGGVTGTQAAYPYIWPPQGGAGGGGGNPFGPNAITKDFDVQQWGELTGPLEHGKMGWKDATVTGYKTPSGWKTAKDKNIEHLGWRGYPSVLGNVMNKWMGTKIGERKVGDIKGTFTDKTLSDILGKKKTTPVETIDIRDKFDRTAEEEEDEKIRDIRRKQIINRRQVETDPIVFGMGDVIPPGTGDPKEPIPPRFPTSTWTPAGEGGQGGGVTPESMGMSTVGGGDPFYNKGGRIGYYGGRNYEYNILKEKGYLDMMKDMSASEIGALYDSVMGTFSQRRAQGGRIGYADRGFVEDVNVEGPGFDENVMMASDDNNTRILENLFDKYIELGFSPADAEKMAMQEFEQMSQGPEQDQGLASLV